VQDLGCDFLVCSPYKFFGPHQGVLWGKYEILDRLPPYKVRPADDDPPGKFETGTQSHEGQAGTLGALEYLVWAGRTMGQNHHHKYQHFNEQAKWLHAGLDAIREYEKGLSAHLIRGLAEIPGVHVHGITHQDEMEDRVPTVSFTVEGIRPEKIARHCADHNIFVWRGHYYALEVVRHLGLEEAGGMVRIGPVHYNTVEEIDHLLEVVDGFIR
jgi:selenocysteine lyase/cysteine desulfurase